MILGNTNDPEMYRSDNFVITDTNKPRPKIPYKMETNKTIHYSHYNIIWHLWFWLCLVFSFSVISLHIRSMWETTVMHKQVSGWTVNFGPNFPESPFLELKTRKPPLPISENFRFGMTKVYSGIPPPPHFRKLQIWDDQSLLWNTPPFWKTYNLGWPKFTPE